MDREPLPFVTGEGHALATARLLFTPTKITRITGPAGVPKYVEGKDFVWKPGTNLLTLTADSRIPFKTRAQMHPMNGEPHSIASGIGVSSGLLWSEGNFFQTLQVEATYDHEEAWTVPAPDQPGVRLSATIDKLKAKTPLRLVILGDSISQGGNASGFIKAAPYQPPYPDLVVAGLESHYRLAPGTISLVNLSVGGTSSSWGVDMIPTVVAEGPDLVVIAFGMNDTACSDPQHFRRNIAEIIAGVRQYCPDAQFILVASMAGNPEWKLLHSERFAQFRDQLKNLRTQGIDVADVTTLWERLMQVKKFTDLTGNGVNHPNDFGHRLYAQIILQLLAP
jgi:lysophospholipase L1-like esterase